MDIKVHLIEMLTGDTAMKEICTLCNYILEEEQGLPEAGIAPGTKFESLPEDWEMPWLRCFQGIFPDLFLCQPANFRG